ncbi:glycosyl hydrolases family 18-domain-containing protein [Apiospora saccharicola]
MAGIKEFRMGLPHSQLVTLLLVLSLFALSSLAVPAHQHRSYRHASLHGRAHHDHAPHQAPKLPQRLPSDTCLNEAYDPFDYSVKPARPHNQPVCPKDSDLAATYARDVLLGRQVTQQEDYSCSETKPCSNGACCPKETGWCNYGPKACGTNNISPNDVCWSNCDAKAECGRYAATPGKKCPLNVCCSPFGFCGMTEDFCKVTDDKELSCQSNCDQPKSGASGSNARDRVIGYYEAWVHDRKCNGMSIDQIPVGALTHLMFSFAYITPGEFQIVPMDDLDPKLFSQMSALKKQNKGLKVMVALGGWTFNDPGATQRVFHDVASTRANRAKFIGNLLSFLRQYAYDGVDFDWEYPGATDRGGAEGDGENFTLLLEELKDAIKSQPIDYQVSFTTPTSYWYLRHFDIKASAAAVDFVNVMSYDLHGVWDADNPIGSNVLAHTNLTEIRLALDLYWRNGVGAEKLNLGIGFYGRSFQLADPSCHEPGCKFLGGASPGSCTKNSGTLSYREIVDIVEKHKLKPYYDKKNQVKWIVWNNDQWISYDDEETIEAKVKFANEQGLGGLLIWSVDQDTDDLKALGAVVGSQKIKLARKNLAAQDAAYWKDVGAQNCYVTGCGGSCNPGFQALTTQPCGDATFLTRHSTEEDSTLCCPLDAMPDKSQCGWRSDAPTCEGRCDDGEVMLEMNKWGDGKYCEEGNKAYCCNSALETKNECYWSGMGQLCKTDDLPLTFEGAFLGKKDPDKDALNKLRGNSLLTALKKEELKGISLYCCPDTDFKRWNDCSWHGKPGSCFDAHCDANSQVQLTWSTSGGAEYCGGRFDRTRVYCCGAPEGEALFLPVSLDKLFPSPPKGSDIQTNFDLKVDDTWGGAETGDGSDDEPNDGSFQFYVLAAPDEIQTSLDKRDGSDWELFNCHDSTSEEEQTVQMVCTDDSDNSNCDHIFQGLGAVGTIVQMPQGYGCGPGKYAVVKSLEMAQNQTMPKRLEKRASLKRSTKPKVYDLTFDYDFRRVPRDFGETQLRVDFSNQEGYWDRVVDAPARKAKKRSLASVGGNHKRWLEEEWREDMHFGGLSRRELHKRWFGKDALDWLKGLLNIEIKKEKRHDYDEDVSVTILEEEWDCGNFKGKIDAIATAGISMSTSFGFTLITTLGPDMNLDNSFLHFNNEGKIEAIFTLDAVARVDWQPKAFEIAKLPFPGGSFNIPGILTIGPSLKIMGQFKAGVSISGRVEARVSIAEWDIRQTYPQIDGYNPQVEGDHKPKSGIDVQNLANPSFDASLQADGYLEAHLMPTLVFGIDFNKAYNIDSATVSLEADGWARVRVHSDIVGGDCAFGYRVEAGCSLTASAEVPDVFGWHPSPYKFGELDKKLIPKEKEQEWQCLTGGTRRDTVGTTLGLSDGVGSLAENVSDVSLLHGGSGLRKRLTPYPAVIKLPSFEQFCPTKASEVEEKACPDIFAADEFYDDPEEDLPFSKRSIDNDDDDDVDLNERYFDYLRRENDTAEHVSELERRVDVQGKKISICYTVDGKRKNNAHEFYLENWTIKDYTILDNEDWGTCSNFNFGVQPQKQKVKNKRWGTKNAGPKVEEFVGYRVEHILEGNQLDLFMVANSDLCGPMENDGWFKKQTIDTTRKEELPWEYIGRAYPFRNSPHEDEFYSIIEPVNIAKENVFLGNNVMGLKDLKKMKTEAHIDSALVSMKITLMTWKYLNDPTVKAVLKKQADRVGDRMEVADEWFDKSTTSGWTKRDLRGRWQRFIKSSTDVGVAKLKTHLEEWMPKIEKILPTDTSQDATIPGRAERRQKIAALRREVDALTTFSSPF